MENENPKFDLISMMVDETFATHEDNILQFSDYQKKNTSSEVIVGAYDSERRCYLLIVNGNQIEFPENWAIFKKYNYQVDIDKSNDNYGLIEVFSELLPLNIRNLKFEFHSSFFKLNIVYFDENIQKAA